MYINASLFFFVVVAVRQRPAVFLCMFSSLKMFWGKKKIKKKDPFSIKGEKTTSVLFVVFLGSTKQTQSNTSGYKLQRMLTYLY